MRRTLGIIGFSTALGLFGCGGDDETDSGASTTSGGTTTTDSASSSPTAGSSPTGGPSSSGSQSGSASSATMTTQGTTDDATATETADTSGSSSDGSSSVGSDSTGAACCDPDDTPPCIEGATCCATGEWECNTGGGPPPCDQGEICGDCQPMGVSCSEANACCGDLVCCPLGPGGGQMACMEECTGVSDRNVKENFVRVDAHEVLEQVAALEITMWNYRWDDPSVRHLGPMAQDVAARFGVGKTDKRILQVDGDGIALSAIQALHSDVAKLRAENGELRKKLDALTAKLDRANDG